MDQLHSGNYIDPEFEQKLHDNQLHHLFPIVLQIAQSYGLDAMVGMCVYMTALIQYQMESPKFKVSKEYRDRMERIYNLSAGSVLRQVSEIEKHMEKYPEDVNEVIIARPAGSWSSFFGPDLRHANLVTGDQKAAEGVLTPPDET